MFNEGDCVVVLTAHIRSAGPPQPCTIHLIQSTTGNVEAPCAESLFSVVPIMDLPFCNGREETKSDDDDVVVSLRNI